MVARRWRRSVWVPAIASPFIMLFPPAVVAPVTSIPVIATIVAGAEGYGDARCLYTHVVEIDVNIAGMGKPWRGCKQSTQQEFFHG